MRSSRAAMCTVTCWLGESSSSGGRGTSYCGFAISVVDVEARCPRDGTIDGEEAADEAALLACAARSRWPRLSPSRKARSGLRLAAHQAQENVVVAVEDWHQSGAGHGCTKRQMNRQGSQPAEAAPAGRRSREKPWLAWISARVYSFDACARAQGRGGRFLDGFAVAHDQQPVAQMRDDREVVADQDVGQAELARADRRAGSAPPPGPRRRAPRSARRAAGPSGRRISARAIAMRWRWPPESWCG